MVWHGPRVRYFTESGHIMSLLSVALPQSIVSMLVQGETDHEVEDAIKEVFSTPDLLFGWNLLALPYKRLQAFILCSRNFKKLWRETLEEDCDKKIKNLIYDGTWLGMFQAILESAPQFIIQLQATIFQQEQVSTIQIVSLSVSSLNVAWTVTNADV